MKAEDIKSAYDIEAWLKGLPEDQALQVVPQIAFRAAARVFPLWGSIETRSTTSRSDASSLPLLRAMCLQWIALSDIQGLNKNVFRSCRKYVSEGVKGGFQIVRPATSNMLRTRATVGNVIVSIIGQKHFDTIWRANDAIDHAAVEKNFINISVVDPQRGDALFYSEVELSNDSSETRLINCKLWPTQAPDWFSRADRETRAIWAEDPETWSFWERWWDGLISGTMPFPRELLREVVLIEDGIWQAGPKAVAERIAGVMEGFDVRQPATSKPKLFPDQVIDRALKVQTSVSASEIAQVKKAISAVRDDLPTTFEAILDMVALEIERLQTINYISDEHRDICVQQIRTLTVLHRAIERLRNAVP